MEKGPLCREVILHANKDYGSNRRPLRIYVMGYCIYEYYADSGERETYHRGVYYRSGSIVCPFNRES